MSLHLCGFSSSGRAPPCQGGGSGFEPRNPLHFIFGRCPLKCKIRRGNSLGVLFYIDLKGMLNVKKVLSSCSVLSGVIALAALVFGIRGLFDSSRFIVDLAMFSMIAKGSFMGFIGNVLSVIILCGGFGAMAYYGLSGGQSAKRKAFGYGVAMTAICILSLIFAVFGHSFTIGDLFIAVLPAVYSYAVLRTA